MRSGLVLLLFVVVALGAWLVTPSCSEPEEPKTPAERGRRVYAMFCLACHHADPGKPGIQGPEVAGSSLELLRSKILRNEYPPGYTPKRTTKNMAAPMPLTDAQIEELHAFLNEAPPGGG